MNSINDNNSSLIIKNTNNENKTYNINLGGNDT